MQKGTFTFPLLVCSRMSVRKSSRTSLACSINCITNVGHHTRAVQELQQSPLAGHEQQISWPGTWASRPHASHNTFGCTSVLCCAWHPLDI